MGESPIMGIYKITCLENNKIYIGSSIHIKTRWTAHKNLLNRKKHSNKHLQNAWNKYGEYAFKFEILEEINDEESLLTKEQEWLIKTRSFNQEIGFNIIKVAENKLGFTHSDETKEKLRSAQLGRKMHEITRKAIANANNGRKNTEETKKKMSESQKNCKRKTNVLTEEDVIEIKYRILNLERLKDIALDYNVGERQISAIKNGKRWWYILPDLDLKSINLKKNKGKTQTCMNN